MDLFLAIFLTTILVASAIIDIRVQKIPNLLTLPTIVVGLVYHTSINGWDGLIASLGGTALGIALFIIPYSMGGMGAGDAKLMGAVGSIVGVKGVLIASLFTAIAGGIYALIVFAFNSKYFKSFINRSALTIKAFALTKHFIPIPADDSEKKPKLCYGVAIAVGTISYVMLVFFGYKFPVSI